MQLLIAHGGNPADFDGAAAAAAALGGRPRLATALLAACPCGMPCVGSMALLPLLQGAICDPGFPWRSPGTQQLLLLTSDQALVILQCLMDVPLGPPPLAEPASLRALRWLLPRLALDHTARLVVMGLALPLAALQVGATLAGVLRCSPAAAAFRVRAAVLARLCACDCEAAGSP